MHKNITKVALAVVLLVGLSACGHHPRHERHHRHGGARTHGLGQDMRYTGIEQEDLLSKNIIYFDFDRAEVQDHDIPLLQAHADYLKENRQRRVIVHGHTDEQGSRQYNVALGERRARSVANVLMSEGVHQNQISVVSYGKEKLAREGHDEEVHKLNRRSEVEHASR